MSSDVRDILDLEDQGPRKSLLDTRTLLNRTDKKKTITRNAPQKRPDHIPREVWGLQNTFKNELPPLIPVDEHPVYKQPKAVIGTGRVRKWKWVPFTNSARSDKLVLNHWCIAGDVAPEEDYYFARFNKHMEVPTFSPSDYLAYLQDPKWTPEQTDHLMELAKRFEIRFVHMNDCWDVERFPPRPSIEELKSRYYGILSSLDMIRGTNLSQGLRYDIDHERRRKQQLALLYGRSRDEVQEEERLITELSRIESRRRDRERKKQDLQKLISQAESVSHESCDQQDFAHRENVDDRGFHRTCSSVGSVGNEASSATASGALSTASRKRPIVNSFSSQTTAAVDALAGRMTTASNSGSISAGLATVSSAVTQSLVSSVSIPFPDFRKNPGVHLRSQRMKIPSSLGQRRIRVIDNFLSHFQMDPSPPATAQIVDAYNILRGNILLLYDLRSAMIQCDYELQASRSRMELFAPDRPLPQSLKTVTKTSADNHRQTLAGPELASAGSISTAIPAGVDSGIISALKVADLKRPVLPRHSLGIPGNLNAASGRVGLAINNCKSTVPNTELSSGQRCFARNIKETPHDSPSSLRRSSIGAVSTSMPTTSSRVSTYGQSQSSINASSSKKLLGLPQSARSPNNEPTTTSSSYNYNRSSYHSRIHRKRAAAAEQSRVMKKLKTKGHILDG